MQAYYCYYALKLQHSSPHNPLDATGQFRIIVFFVIEKDGTLTDIKVLKTPNENAGIEAKRVLKGSEKWTPGEQDGKLVRASFTLPMIINVPVKKT